MELKPDEIGVELSWDFLWRDPSGASRLTNLRTSLPDRWSRPIQPAHLRLTRAANLDLQIGSIRQSRIGFDSWVSADIPLGEEGEAYDIEIRRADALVRRLATAVPTAVYSRAEQLADGVVGEIVVSVAQVSRRFGAGARAESKIGI